MRGRASLALAAVLILAGCPHPVPGEHGPRRPDLAPPALISSERPSGSAPRTLAITTGAGHPGRWTRAGAWSRGPAKGVGARIQVVRPAVVGEEHSLIEVEVQLGPSATRHAVELGFRTAPVEYRDADPHLFVFAWVAGRRTCYDGCGWQGVQASTRPGDSLATRIGTEVTLGLVQHEGAWWAWMDSEWLGAFPLEVWNGALSETDGLQWFGEVFAPDGKPRSEMGTGVEAAAPGAATIRGLCHVPWDRWACVEEERPQLRADAPSRYGAALWDDGTMTYGGASEPPTIRPRPPPSSASEGTPPATGR